MCSSGPRDNKLVRTVNKYFQSTAQRFDDEKALQTASFYNLEDDIIGKSLPGRDDRLDSSLWY